MYLKKGLVQVVPVDTAVIIITLLLIAYLLQTAYSVRKIHIFSMPEHVMSITLENMFLFNLSP